MAINELLLTQKHGQFIGFNTYTNKDTGEVSYNIDVQVFYKNYKKIEKLYLNGLKNEEIQKISLLEMGQQIVLNNYIGVVPNS